jgi:superfamily II DNA or RNA helicase
MAAEILAKPIFEQPQRTEFTPNFDPDKYAKWVKTYGDLPESIITQLAKSQERNEFIAKVYADNREKYGKTIIFADRWFQCEQLKTFLERHGVKAGTVYSHVDADLGSVDARNQRDQDENARVLAQFRRNEIDVLINIRMLIEGTDVPDVQTVFLTRQKTSPILLTQMIGRALRGPKFGGTKDAYIVPFIDDWRQTINWATFDLNLVQLETWSFRRIRGKVETCPRIVPVHHAESSIGDVAANPGNPKRDGLAGPASADPRALVGPV